MEQQLKSLSETKFLGLQLAKLLEATDIILLIGELGAGKTTLTQAIAQGLEVAETQSVTSPTFNLLHNYQGRLEIYHIDCYRLQNQHDFEGAGLEDYLYTEGVTIIEWPERIGSLYPETRLDIHLEITSSGLRNLLLVPYGSSWQLKLNKLAQVLNC